MATGRPRLRRLVHTRKWRVGRLGAQRGHMPSHSPLATLGARRPLSLPGYEELRGLSTEDTQREGREMKVRVYDDEWKFW